MGVARVRVRVRVCVCSGMYFVQHMYVGLYVSCRHGHRRRRRRRNRHGCVLRNRGATYIHSYIHTYIYKYIHACIQYTSYHVTARVQ
jgi:hypothetical protein